VIRYTVNEKIERLQISEGKRHLGRPRHKWENNNKIRLQNRSERDGLDSFGSELRERESACGHFLVP